MRRGWGLALGMVVAACGSETSDPDGVGEGGSGERVVTADQIMACSTGPAPDVTSDRLCVGGDDPEAVLDKIQIECSVETGCFAPADVAPKDSILVMAYNVERGLEIDGQLDAWRNDSRLPVPDVLLISEVDRGCTRTDYRDVIREYASALEMDFVYGVEFVELPRGAGSSIETPCEHGNAILSRFPIANPGSIRHATNKSWYDDEGEPRLGGRIAITADVVVGDKNVHVVSVHFESSISEDVREGQAVELAEYGKSVGGKVVIGGDMNSGFYRADLLGGTTLDQTVSSWLAHGYFDAHAALPADSRKTHNSSMILDIIVTNGEFFSESAVAPPELWQGLSDHAPVWTTVDIR